VNVLVLTHRLPYAPNRGDRIRSYHLLRVLRRESPVHLFSLAEPDELAYVSSLESWLSSVSVATPPHLVNRLKGVASLLGSKPLTHTLQSAPRIEERLAQIAATVRPDVVLAYCSGMAQFTVNGPLADIPCVLDMVDVDSAKWDALSTSAGLPMNWIYRREARVLRSFERQACRHAFTTLVVNQRERDTLAALVPDAAITVIENGVDMSFFARTTPPEASREVIFCGVMDYQPNVEGVEWFAEHVWPSVRRAVPDARFTIVGNNPTARVQNLGGIDGITVTGGVDDVRPFLWRAAVSVAPLRTARGLQNKALEALAAGLPVVASSAVGAGLPDAVLPGCRLADDPAEFGEAVTTLLSATVAQRSRVAGSADLQRLSWEARLSAVRNIIARAAAARRSA
jgi:sugar transferase (PEP-CTERM/EpsH1 system associated)